MAEENTGNSKAEWVIEGKELLLKVGNSRVIPTPKEISAVYSGRSTNIQGHQVALPISTNVEEIQFSRFPCDITLEITEPGKNPNAKIIVSYFAERNGLKQKIDYRDILRGHIILENRWYLLSNDNRDEIVECAKRFPDFEKGTLTVGHYLRFIYSRNAFRINYIPCTTSNIDEVQELDDILPSGLALQPYKYQKTGENNR